MAFNYLSRWHRDAPYQRRSLCGNDLLEELHMQRTKDPRSKHRPLIFVGHSFGGIVIEEAITDSISDKDRGYLAMSTVGIVFLGTPHRGSASAKWGELTATIGKWLKLGSEERLLSDIKENSEVLKDVLHKFARWLLQYSVHTKCFFEQEKTDYGKRFGFSWKELVFHFKLSLFSAANMSEGC